MVTIRNAVREEYARIGQMLVDVYSAIEGFPKPDEQPRYYEMLKDVGALSSKPKTEVIVAVSDSGEIHGSVVYFGDMKYYGSGGTATQEPNASGFRLLAVNNISRGIGIAKLLTLECIQRARNKNRNTVVIHTTHAMMNAWRMYEKMGFVRASDLDFIQGDMPVFGFRYFLQPPIL